MRAAGCGVEELVWHYIWMVSQSAASKRFQIAVFWGVVPRNAGGHISKGVYNFVGFILTTCLTFCLSHAVLQTEFCYNQLHPSETAKTITVLDVQGVGIRDLGTCLVIFILSSFPLLRDTLFFC
jgi:hypothetical protein